ncbi:hypothetical protein [Nocardioides pantholopis]|nr:hypothetical protein [Nocardioides pantholopis]
MFTDSSIVAKSEMEYRSTRIRNGVPSTRRGFPRSPRARRVARTNQGTR